jgi:hypothetical protein
MKSIVALMVVGMVALGGPGAGAAEAARAELAPYSGLGTWVDLYNKGPWNHPERVIDKMVEHGAQNLYLETSSYKFKKALVHPNALGTFLDLAHDEGITVVAWYVPSFKPVKKDVKRALAAIDYLSPNSHGFDSFGLDIEATVVQDVAERNARVRRTSRRIRAAVGTAYQLGAIFPDPVGSVFWTDFPYKSIAKNYDVFLPMCYFTYRVNGAKAVYRYMRSDIRAVHERTGMPHAAVHPIGGIADAARAREVRAYVRAAFDGHALGGSFYDFPITRSAQWDALHRLRKKRVSGHDAAAAPAGGHRHLP